MAKPKKKPGMFDDPSVPNEKDPVFMEEMFDLYERMGDTPEDIAKCDPDAAKQYAAWLKKQREAGK